MIHLIISLILVFSLSGCAWLIRGGKEVERQSVKLLLARKHMTEGCMTNEDLILLCEVVDMKADIGTQNCIRPDGSQVSPSELHPPFPFPSNPPDCTK